MKIPSRGLPTNQEEEKSRNTKKPKTSNKKKERRKKTSKKKRKLKSPKKHYRQCPIKLMDKVLNLQSHYFDSSPHPYAMRKTIYSLAGMACCLLLMPSLLNK